jgi:hypothetical protein
MLTQPADRNNICANVIHSKSVNWDNIRKSMSQRHFDDNNSLQKSSIVFYIKTYIHSTYSMPKRRITLIFFLQLFKVANVEKMACSKLDHLTYAISSIIKIVRLSVPKDIFSVSHKYWWITLHFQQHCLWYLDIAYSNSCVLFEFSILRR